MAMFSLREHPVATCSESELLVPVINSELQGTPSAKPGMASVADGSEAAFILAGSTAKNNGRVQNVH